MNKRKIGILCIALGVVMLFEAVLLFRSYQRKEESAGRASQSVLEVFYAQPQSTGSESEQAQQQEIELYQPEFEALPTEMETVVIDGLEILGVIRVPSCGIELPVISSWDYTLLDAAPCRYTGDLYTGDLVVMGHNYTTHFRPLKQVQVGETVEFEDVNGKIWRFRVDAIDSVHRDNVQALPSDHELILFTCETNRVNRFVARCKLEETV